MKIKCLFLFALTFGPLTAFAQTTVLLPLPVTQFFNANGTPLANGSLGFYASGTFNAQGVFSDATGVTPLSNPVPLNAGGYPQNGSGSITGIWLSPGMAYRVQAKDANGVQQWLIDGVTGLASSQATVSTAVTFSATPAFLASGQNQLFTITLTGNVTSSTFSVSPGLSAPVLVTFEITQDGAGGRTFAWPPNSQGGSNINLNPNAVTLEHFVWDGSTLYPLGSGRSPLSGGVGSPGSNVYSINLQQPNSANNVSLLKFQTNSSAVTGTGSTFNLYVYTLQANTLSVGKMLRIITCVSHSGSASVTYLLKFGTATLQNMVSTSAGEGCITELVASTGASAQTAIAPSASGVFSGATTAAVQNPAIDQTAPQTISISFNVANTDTVTPYFFSVELVQ